MQKNKTINFVINILNKLEKYIYENLLKIDKKISNKLQYQKIKASTKYNMDTEFNENFYADQYMIQMKNYLPEPKNVKNIIDIGCGQGRLIFKLAEIYVNANITGIDISENAINYAAEISKMNKQINYINGNYADVLDDINKKIDIAVFTEVSFYDPSWKKNIIKIISKLSSNGLFVGSFRSTYFNTLMQISNGNFIDAERIVNTNSGSLTLGDSIDFTWDNSEDLKIFFEVLGLRVVSTTGIGVCSGIPGDPLSKVAIPKDLSLNNLQILQRIENKLSSVVPDAGRYILIIAKNK